MKNILDIKHCYGCGVCATICPEKIIKLELNEEGFYAPRLFNAVECSDCGLCLSVCAYNDDKLSVENTDEPHCYAAWSNNENVRRNCSSGGVGFAIGEYLINQGYKAIGVRYNAELGRAEHFLADTVDGFIPSIGSKYIPSYTLAGFYQINCKDKFFVTGTPCQIDSLRRYIRQQKIEANFVLMDFFCHGVPSMLMWKKYTELVEKQTGKIVYASWRNKRSGWQDSLAMGIGGEKGDAKIDGHENKENKTFDYFSSMSKGDLFYRFFLGNTCLGKACYDKCKYKMAASAADMRIGDLWGKTYQNNQDGVSALLVFTKKGKQIISALKDNCTIIPAVLDVVGEGQMKTAPYLPLERKNVLVDLRSGKSLTAIANKMIWKYRISNLHKILYRKLFE